MSEVDKVREDFAREVDIVRGAGGVAPTTSDLMAYGERLAYAALSDHMPEWTDDDERDQAQMDIAYHWDLRHDVPEIRPSLRRSIATLKRLRREAA